MATTAGERTGGRVKGTPNRATQQFMDHMDELRAQGLDCDPIKVLMEIAIGKKQGADGVYREIVGAWDEEGRPVMLDAKERVKAASELCSYVFPKRKAVEVTGMEGQPISFAVVMDNAPLPGDLPAELPPASSAGSLADGPVTLLADRADEATVKERVRKLTTT